MARLWLRIISFASLSLLLLLASCDTIQGTSSGGRFVYAASQADSTITVLRADTTGALTVVGSPVMVGTVPRALATTSDGRCLFAGIDSATQSQLVAFTIGSDGGLTAVNNGVISVPIGITSIVRSEDFLFVATSTSIAAFRIGVPNCTLTQVPGSPFLDTGVLSMSVVGNGGFIAGIHGQTALGQGRLSMFAIDGATGALTQALGSPMNIPGANFGVAGDTSGQFVYVSVSPGQGGPAIDGVLPFRIGASGTLTQGSNTPTPVAPSLLAVSDSVLLVTTAGSAPTLLTFRTNADGTLTATNQSIALNRPATSIALDDTGHVYLGIVGSGGIAGFNASATGSLSTIPGSPFLNNQAVDAIATATLQTASVRTR